MAMLPKKLSDTLIRLSLSKLAPGEHSDPATPGFSIWIAKPDRTGQKSVTFNSRISLAGMGRKATRPRQFLAKWKDQNPVTGLDVEEARTKFEERKRELTDPKWARDNHEKAPTLGEALKRYVERRTAGDRQTAPQGRKLGVYWGEHSRRFAEMMASTSIDYMQQPVDALTRDIFVQCKEAYLKDCLKGSGHARMRASIKAKRGGDKEIGDHRLRPIFSTMGLFLGWLVKKNWLRPGDIADLRPDQYADDTRFLYPGEWQVICPRLNALENEAGLFIRFIALTSSRVGAALAAQWSDLPRLHSPLKVVIDGEQHDALIWIARHTKGSDSVVRKMGEEDEPQRILLIGESLDIVRRLRKLHEANRKAHPGDDFDGIFSREILAKWASCPSYWQRWIEEGIDGLVPFDRHTLRRTQATYMGYVGTPKHLISTNLTHAMDDKNKQHSETTDIYALNDSGDDFSENDPLRQVAPYLLRLQRLFRDFERGRMTPPIERLQGILHTGPISIAMRTRHKVADTWIALKEKPVALSVVA